jgi:multidrug efflux pump subunit AcrA (membrane-fusion protein)
MFSKVSLNFGLTKSLIIPGHTVLKQQGTNERYVFVEENGKAKRIPVQINKRLNDMVEISNGLKIGDKLIFSGHSNLMDNSPVEVVK